MILRKVVFRQVKKQLRAVGFKPSLPLSHSYQTSRSANLPISSKTLHSKLNSWFSTQGEGKEKKNDSATIQQQKPSMPIGVTNFLLMKDSIGYFDRTGFIPKQILNKKIPVLRMSFYRRVGKTGLLSTIQQCFFWQQALNQLLAEQYKKKQTLLLELASLQEQLKDCQLFSFKELKSQSYSQHKMDLFKENEKKLEKRISNLKPEIDKLKKELQVKEKQAKQKYGFDKIFEGKQIKQNLKKEIELHPTISIYLQVPGNKDATYQQVFYCLMDSLSKTFEKHNYLRDQLLFQLKSTPPDSRKKILNLLARFQFYLNLKGTDKEVKLDQLVERWPLDDLFFVQSITFLCQLLQDYWKTQPIILIDEYDQAFLYALQHPQKERILGLLGAFYLKTIKTNDQNYFKAIIMGILPIKYGNYESELNNYVQLNAASENICYPFFGFTHQEVKKKLEQLLEFRRGELKGNFNRVVDEQMDILKKWANGYWISGFELYNPWTVVNCLDQIIRSQTLPLQNFQNTWVGTGHLSTIKKILQKFSKDYDLEQQLFSFIANQFEHQSEFSFHPLVMVDQIFKPKYLFYLLYHCGYLTKDKSRPNVYVVPNKEIEQYFFDQLFMSLLEQHFPNVDRKKVKNEIWNAGKEVCLNIENCEVFAGLLEELLNKIIQLDLKYFISVYDHQTVAEKAAFYEKHIKLSFVPAQRDFERTNDYKGYNMRFEVVPFSEKKEKVQEEVYQNRMDRFIFSQYSNKVIIHEDKVIERSADFDKKKIEALKQILEKQYMKNVEKTYQNAVKIVQKKRNKTITSKDPKKLEYVEIAAIVVCQPQRKSPYTETKSGQLEVNIKNSQNTQYRVQVQSESYTFPLENLSQLFQDYKSNWKSESIGSDKRREEFRKMLEKYSFKPTKTQS